ncbi:MAG: hypothetical protein AUI84_02880 [Delftia sp. 13_1_40CM_3_66_6]|nr:MAG: hypothetical protein AUI84_02880 [Delftia sp. 13_1_40CM_3_66_6]
MEEIQRAIDLAYAIEESDPEAAKQLLAQAERARARLDGSNVGAALEPYDAMRTRARLLYHYRGGLTYRDVKTMDYREFFGFIRELDCILEEQREQRNQGNSMDMTRVVNEFPRPQPYEGETIKLI